VLVHMQQDSEAAGIASKGASAILQKSVPWARLFAEAVAIVASILMAFSLDAAWTEHRESQQERLVSDRLTEELEANVSSVEQGARALAHLHANAEELAGLLGSSPQSELMVIPNSLIASLFFNPEWSSLKTAMADGLQLSRQLSLLDNPSLSEGLSLWTSRRAAVALRSEELREHFNERLLPHLSSEIDIGVFISHQDPYRVRENADRDFPWLGLDGTTELTNTAMFRNLVLQRILFVGRMQIQVDMAASALFSLRETLAGLE